MSHLEQIVALMPGMTRDERRRVLLMLFTEFRNDPETRKALLMTSENTKTQEIFRFHDDPAAGEESDHLFKK